MNYRTEMHMHSCEMSPCGHVPVREMVRLYHEAGYSTLVLTDHYYPRIYEAHGGVTHEELVALYEKNVSEAVKTAEPFGMTVLYGIEIRFTDADNDYLVYGMDFDYFRKHSGLMNLGLKDFSALCRREGFYLIQAHPFRKGMKIQDPALLDAMEVHNGHPRHDFRNDIARLWAMKYGLTAVSGSDAHQVEDVARGGIVTDERILSMDQLITVLKKGDFRLIENGDRGVEFSVPR